MPVTLETDHAARRAFNPTRNPLDYANLLENLLANGREAAAVIARVYATDFAVEFKGPRDPVTKADREANTLICDRLRAEFPGVVIVAEESSPADYAGWASSDRVFFVDPLDGTLEFVARNGEFAVMIGLAERGRATAGILVAPATGIAWAGAPTLGAWEIDARGQRARLQASTLREIERARVAVSRSHRGKLLEAAIAAIAPAELVPRGSAGLKAADVATARADLYVQPGRAGKRWDACAPEAIVRAAGGLCTDTDGNPIDYASGELENDGGLVMSNGLLHEEAIARLRKACASAAT